MILYWLWKSCAGKFALKLTTDFPQANHLEASRNSLYGLHSIAVVVMKDTLCAQGSHQVFIILRYSRIALHKFFGLACSVQNSGVIAPTESITDLGK